tara:strand:- start:1001 stop:1867 length:867 start_codon:yes stop_codon:yes gene_type:complete
MVMNNMKNILFVNFIWLILFMGCSHLKANSVESVNSNVVMPTTEYSPGFNRIVFSIINNEGPESEKPLQVSVENMKTSKSFDVDPIFYNWPNKSGGFYVLNITFAVEGDYSINIHDLSESDFIYKKEINVNDNQLTPKLGELIPFLDNKISTGIYDINEITSDPDPDYDFYKFSLSDALEHNKLIIVFFLSPNFCKTATCFPQLDVLKKLKSNYHDKITFIHVEIYENPHLIKGNLKNAKISPVLNEWNIKSEPYTFLIDKNNYLFRKFQGYVSYEEIENYIVKLINE